MPDSSPPAAGGGSGVGAALKGKVGPLPTWVWLGLITVILLGYWLVTKNKSGASSSSGQQGTPSDVGQPGVVVINQGDTDTGAAPPPPPSPPPHGPPPEPQSRQITLDKNETLAELAKQRHWSSATLQAVENENVMQGGGKLTAQSKLHKGQTIIRPLKG